MPALKPVDTHVIPLDELTRKIAELGANSDFGFSEEYECVETGDEFSREASLQPLNKVKNRYANILSYDHSRYRLKRIEADLNTDYINANWLHGYAYARHYIAAQGPNPVTVNDFWRMIFESDCAAICMLTGLEEKGRIKCERYWPQSTRAPMLITSPIAEPFQIAMEEEEVFPEYVIRTFVVTYMPGDGTGGTKEIMHYHFTGWPDHGVPDSPTSMLEMLRRIRTLRQSKAGPLVVHCSAGVGRTGTLAVLDMQMDRMAEENCVDIYGTVNTLRRQRSTIVQTEEQYILCYQAAQEAIASINTEVAARSLPKHVSDANANTRLSEWKRLGDTPTNAFARRDSGLMAENRAKNRYQQVLPLETTRVRLSPKPGVVGSDYINANFVDGYRKRAEFIATQGPLEDTVIDFWRMVWDYSIQCVVMLTNLKEDNRSKCEQYWPDKDELDFLQGSLKIVLVKERKKTVVCGNAQSASRLEVIVRDLTVTEQSSGVERKLRQWHYKHWPESGSPDDARPVARLVDDVQTYQRGLVTLPQEDAIYGNQASIDQELINQQTTPVVVHCDAGAGRTGAFIAIWNCIGTLRFEKRVDLFCMTKTIRRQREFAVQTADQYEFCYRAILSAAEMDKETGFQAPVPQQKKRTVSVAMREAQYKKLQAQQAAQQAQIRVQHEAQQAALLAQSPINSAANAGVPAVAAPAAPPAREETITKPAAPVAPTEPAQFSLDDNEEDNFGFDL
jgi:netrin-G3 ligand